MRIAPSAELQKATKALNAIMPKPKPSAPDEPLLGDPKDLKARLFAEREGRKAGLID
jgi:hypothetical protein